LIPQSPFGQFENLDVLRRKFSPLSKNEVYFLEEEYMNKANIRVVPGIIKFIDVDKKEIEVKGYHEKLEFEKLLLAWGSVKKRLDKEFTNVFYLEDRQAHARCHNELLKAKTIVVLGGTIEAYQSAASLRDYLDSIGFNNVQIVLLNHGKSELHQTFGTTVARAITKLMTDKRISVLMDCEITQLKGLNRLESIHFKREEDTKPEKLYSKEGITEHFIKPDLVIAENGLGMPKVDLNELIN
jgi:NADH dehydrogenase FAD-containing subunit